MTDPTDLSAALSSAEAVFRKRFADVRGEVGLNGTKIGLRLFWNGHNLVIQRLVNSALDGRTLDRASQDERIAASHTVEALFAQLKREHEEQRGRTDRAVAKLKAFIERES